MGDGTKLMVEYNSQLVLAARAANRSLTCEETHYEDNAHCRDLARRLPADRHRCALKRRRNLSPLVRRVLGPRWRIDLHLHFVRTVHDDSDPGYRRLLRAEPVVLKVRPERLVCTAPTGPIVMEISSGGGNGAVSTARVLSCAISPFCPTSADGLRHAEPLLQNRLLI